MAMRVATVVLLVCVAGSWFGAPAFADELDDGRSGEGGTSGEAPAAVDSPQTERMQAVGICEQTVAERRENSSAAQWPDRGQYRVTRQGPGQFAIDGYVDVQGALGAVRTTWTCRAIRGYGDQWQGVATLEQNPASAPASAAEPPVPADRLRPPAPDARQPLPAPPSEAAPARPAATSREGWSEVGSCRRLRVVDAYAEKYPNKRMQIVKGAVEYSGVQPIRNVRVCASGTCVLVRGAYPPLQSGAREPFSIEVPSLETVTVTTECSKLEQTAGP